MTDSVIRTLVCIIGAGPAGASASLTLSQNKIPHIIVDSAVFPRHKPCGDIITSGVLRAMDLLDPEILRLLKSRDLVNPIWTTHVYPPNGKPITIDFLPFDRIAGQPSCYSLSRFEMDNVILELVQKSEFASVYQGCRIINVDCQSDGVVLSTEPGFQLKADIVIVATGSNNNILKHFGLDVSKHDSAIGIRAHFENIEFNKSETSLFLDSGIMPGGLYITPLPGNCFNVNLVVSLDKVSSENLNLREEFDKVIESNPVLKQRFINGRRIGNFEGSKLFLGIRKRVIAGNRFLVVGDSAGLIEFFSGNGLPQAILSGRMAALQTIIAIQKSNFSKKFLGKFEGELYHKINQNYAMGRLIYPLLHKRFFSRWVLNFLNFLSRRPQTNDLVRDLLYEKAPSKIVLNPRFLYSLLIEK
jgi:menaquinone-9 beta-reductase